MQKELELLKKRGLLRQLRSTHQQGKYIIHDDKQYLNLSSNDYLGISSDLDLQKEFFENCRFDYFMMGSLSSRLLTGNSPEKEDFEYALARLYNREACLLFNSGYHANIGILPALAGKDDLIIADKLIHASIIDGLKLCGCQWLRYRHNDYNDLESKLEHLSGKFRNIYVVTESIFSMDGDCADLEALVALKRKYSFFLYLDEAHAVGIRGDNGLGLAEEAGLISDVDFIVVPCGKAVASEGAFIVCDKYIKELLINKSRSLIFTTAAPPVNTLWTKFIFEKIPGMKSERFHLAYITDLFRIKLQDYEVSGSTHIIPLLFKDNEECLVSSTQLSENGIWALPVRYPTVPVNKPRIRFSFTAAFDETDILSIYDIILAQKRK